MSNGVTYWSIDTSVSGQLTIKVLPITLQSLIDSNKTTDHYVEIRYALQLDDATAWNERTLEEKPIQILPHGTVHRHRPA